MAGTFKRVRGSRAEVFHGLCEKTAGGLKRHQLTRNKHGRIVSKRKQAAGKKAIKRLFALGYKPIKGKFKLMSRMSKSKKSRRTRKRGGASGSVDLFADASGAQANPIAQAMKAMQGM
jgi:hypothetical protein